MNHDHELKILALSLKLVLTMYDAEIEQIKNPKHRIKMVQEFEMARHYMLKMSQCFDELNQWFTAFGVDGDGCKHS